MQISQYLERIRDIDRLIRLRRTGTPGELADQIGLSQSMTYEYLSFMRSAGAPIAYSKRWKTYFYLYPVEFTYGFSKSEVGSRKSE